MTHFTMPPTDREVVIRIDNQDRAACPATPWAAAMFIDGEHTGTAGIGATPQAAIDDLLSYDWTEELA